MTDYTYDSPDFVYDEPGVAYNERTTGGRASGSVLWTAAVSGYTVYGGFAAGVAVWSGAVSGSSARSGRASGSVVWAGAAEGSSPRSAYVAGVVTWTGRAKGPRLVHTLVAGLRFHAQKMPSGDWITHDLPISDVAMHHDLSGPSAITGSIARGFASDVTGAVTAWGTAVYAEESGTIRGGFILTDVNPNPDSLEVSGIGFAGYLAGIPFDSGYTAPADGADPMDVVRVLWNHVQGFPDGNIGMVVDSTTCDVRLGKLDADGKGESYSLHWWDHTDCGSEIDNLAGETPFDYVEYHTWSGETVSHGLQLGYPRIGTRRHDLRFVLGENLAAVPLPRAAGGYANNILALGAGEGAKRLRATAGQRTDRLRRVAVVGDKGVTRKRRLGTVARAALDTAMHAETVTEVDVIEHPNAPLAVLRPGDEIRVQADLGWTVLDRWVRMTSIAYKPDDGVATLTVEQV